MLCTISVPPPSSSGLFGRKLLQEGGSLQEGGRQHWRGREVRQNGHCVAVAVIAQGLRECRVNESDEKLLF